jgi:hypothetical protein
MGIPLPGVTPPPPGGLGAGIFPFAGVPVALPGLEGEPFSTSQIGRRHVDGGVASVAGAARWQRSGAPVRLLGAPGAPGAPGASGAPGGAAAAGLLLSSHRLPADGRTRPRPAHPAAAPIPAALPISSPITGGGPAAAAAGTGGGAAAASLMAVAALLLLFTLSIPVSLDMSAWRSTLLSLRLERPG